MGTIIKRATLLQTQEVKTDPTAELISKVAQMDEYQARLVLSFVKTLWPDIEPDGSVSEAVAESQSDLAA